MSDYPEHEKLAKVKDLSQEIGAFLEWANVEHGWFFAHYPDGEDFPWRIRQTTQDVLAMFFEIDRIELEREKEHMLLIQRKMNERSQ